MPARWRDNPPAHTLTPRLALAAQIPVGQLFGVVRDHFALRRDSAHGSRSEACGPGQRCARPAESPQAGRVPLDRHNSFMAAGPKLRDWNLRNTRLRTGNLCSREAPGPTLLLRGNGTDSWAL